MAKRRFLVPIGVAVSALLPTQSQANQSPVDQAFPNTTSTQPAGQLAANAGGSVVQELFYRIGTERHLMLLKRAGSGIVFAAHESHASHSSHSSHRSHRSGG